MDYKTQIKNISQSCVITKINDDAWGFLAAEISKNFSKNDFLFIASNDVEMENIEKQIRFFAPHLEILNFYAWDCLPYDRASPKPTILTNRIKTLYQLANRAADKNFFVITSINSLLQKTLPSVEITSLGLYLKVGLKISLNQIAEFLVLKGYSRQICANNISEFALRGGIIDIVMQLASDLIGYRIDFLGDEIESIKVFDPLTQITQENVKELEILPASEVIISKKTIENFRHKYRDNFGAAIDDQLYGAISEGRTYHGMEHWLPFFFANELGSFCNYLKNPAIFFSDRIFDLAKKREELINEYYKSRVDGKKESKLSGNPYNPISPELLYFSLEQLNIELAKHITIEFKQFDAIDKNQRILDLEIKSVPDFALAGRSNARDPIDLMKEFILNPQGKEGQKENPEALRKLMIACLSEGFKERLSKILIDYGIACEEVRNFSDIKNAKTGKATLCVVPFNSGFYSSDLMIIGEQAIFGEKIIRKKSNQKAASQRLIDEALSINLGELVVHREHGIARFDGIHTISSGALGGNTKSDFLKLIYANNDTLFVPVDDINLVSRYGADNPLIQLDRLGGANWKNRKNSVKKRIKIAAEALIKIAAARHVKKAPILIPESHAYEEFKARFGFVETDDQLKAIEEVEADLRKGSPMDRLICGDVGFGKTEVAMRASYIAARNETNHYQVAIITPTTLLCRQHVHNFIKRFLGTDIKIAQLSRLVSTAEAKKIKAEIESGHVDIVIGTHALLNKNIKFKNLGLVIVDEEQHFGVAQKERLKELRNEVHILTLSATPIPRTLQMSLTGVKELSLIATPPADRLAVRNFVIPYDSVIVREAVLREHNRSGKVFFVVPRIKDIAEMEDRLKKIMPEMRITHAHGQMTPAQLDQIMNDFYDGKIDVLLSTTIIESGIDIADANTIIIYRAEMFGLSQLYQLRGRVGRGKVRAYAYFMLSPKKIKEDARKKLEVMQNLDSLGVGFTVASYDMDIRGSGNLLGDEQSGHVRETGVELYQQMLLEAITELKNSGEDLTKQSSELSEIDFSVQIKLGISLLIPEQYIEDLSLRMNFYKKIATIQNADDQEKLQNEMINRFGKLPEEVINLMEISNLKAACRKVDIEKLEATSNGILISFKDNKFKAPEPLLQMIFSSKNLIKIHTGQKILFISDVGLVESKIKSAFVVVGKLKELLK